MSKAGLGPEIKNLAGGLKFPADGPLNDFTSRLIKDGTIIDEICSKTQGFDRPDISDKAFKEVHGPEINSLVQQLVGRWRQTSLTALYHLARANANNSQSARGEREVSRELDETAARTLRRMAAFARSGGADFSRLLEDESKQLLSPDNLHELMKSIGFEMTLLETLALCGYLATSSNKGLLSLRVLVDKIDRQVGSMSRRNLRHSSSKKIMKREHSTRESGRRLQKTQEDEAEQDLDSPYHMKQKTPPRSSRVEANFEVDTDQTPYIKRSQSGRVPKEVEEIFAMVAARVAAGECADPLGSLRQADFYGDGAVAVHDVAAALQKFGVHVTSAEGYLVGKHLSHSQKDGLVSLSSMKRMIEKQLSKLSRSKSASRSGKGLKRMELKKKDIN